MKSICNILRRAVMVLSALCLAVSGGALAQNNNWQQHQQLQNTQLAETSQDEMKRGFTGKVTEDGRALVKFQNRIFAVPATRLGITPRDTSTSPAALATSWSPQKQSAINADIQKLASGASSGPGTAAKGEPVKVASVSTQSRIDAARAPRSGGGQEPPANKAQEGSGAEKGGAASAKQAADLSKHLGYAEKYGKGGVKELENGRIRYYGEVQPARNPGEMTGARYVHEYDAATGRSRGWLETVDKTGNVRQERPELNNGSKTHYQFDSNGNHTGSW